MQRNIQQITQHFVDRLPDNDQYYRPDELRSWGFPSFLVNRIKIELERNLEESLIIPKSDWANTQSDPVQHAWKQFVDAIRAEARLPASYGKTVIETAVADILEILVQPRKNVPEVIFGNDSHLSYNEIQERVKAVVVYRHFSKLLLRYMEKKKRDELSRERCKKIVTNADERLTAQYSPLNWAQMLEPLFKLVDGEIDTNLLRLFFEDRNKPRVARKFDLMNETLTRAELIEILSSPDLLDFQGYEDDQSNLFEGRLADDASDKTKQSAESSDRISQQKKNRSTQQQKEKPITSDEESNGSSPADNSRKGERAVETGEEEQEKTKPSFFTDEEEEEDSEEDFSLNASFKEYSEEDDSDLKSGSAQKEQSAENEEFTDQKIVEQDNPSKPAEYEEETASAKSDQTSASENIQIQGKTQSSASEDGEDTPIWMRYMSDEERTEYERQQHEEEEEVEEGFIDDPVIDLTEEDASEKEIEALKDQLSGERNLFVEKIFGGSERAFDEAVEEIATYDNWRQASKYIEKDIFKRNLVDMYSEAAISFTDQLQSYFIGKQNKN